MAAQGTVPITMYVANNFGDPEVLGTSFGNNSVASLDAPEVAPGFFFGVPEATGPFISADQRDGGPGRRRGHQPVRLGRVLEHRRRLGAERQPGRALLAADIAPGQTGTITLTFTPNAPKGTVVHGFIGVDTFNLATSR